MSATSPIDTIAADRGRWADSSLALLAGRVAFGLGLLCLWAYLASLAPNAVASPIAVVQRLTEDLASGSLLRNSAYTLSETLQGFAIGAVLGVMLPLVLWRSQRIMQAIEPFIVTAIGVPKLAFAPVLILWFGAAMTSKVVLVALMVFFMIFTMTVAGIRSLDVRLVASLRIMGASSFEVMREVGWNSTAPFVLTALKIGLPRAFSAAVVGEFLASQHGLGNAIARAQSVGDVAGVYAGIVAVTTWVILGDYLLGRLEKHLLRWRPVTSHF